MMRCLKTLAAAALTLAAVVPSQAHAQKVCVYDPAGRTGFIFKMMEGWATNAASWGATVELAPYTDEATAVNDFTAGKCDGVAASGVRLQRYNAATYTVEAVGGIPTYDLLGPVLKTLQTKANYAPMFDAGPYETVGIYPLGAVYVMSRDRSIDTLAEIAGKKVAALDYDKASALAVQRMGGSAIATDLATLGPMFNNGELDICFLPATAYTPFELWKGLGENGGVLKQPLLQVTLQIMVHDGKFPAGFGGKSRTFVAGDLPAAMATIKKAESEIPAKYWVTPTAQAQAELDAFTQKMRLELRDDKKSYDAAVLSLLKKARCNADGSRAECAQNLE